MADPNATYQRLMREGCDDAREAPWWVSRIRHGGELTVADLAACAALVMDGEPGAARRCLVRHIEREVENVMRWDGLKEKTESDILEGTR